MEPALKQRLTGAAVLVILAVIFIPMVLDTSTEDQPETAGANIPAPPADMPKAPDEDFSSRVVPLPDAAGTVPPETEEAISSPPAAAGADFPPAAETELAPPPAAPVLENTGAENGVGISAWAVQLGSFSSEENAQELNRKLRAAGFKAFVEPLKQDSGTVYRVRVGPELKRSDADAIKERLQSTLKMEGIVVHYP